MKSNKLFLVFILVTAITSWFSIGFYHVDEHFQILEFAAWKAGWISAQDLPWEFPNAMRSGIEPFIIFLLIKVLGIFNCENPFVVTLLMRLISAIMCITCFWLWRNHVKRSADPVLLRWYDVGLLLWFIPYLSVRFSSEIWGACLFFISLALVYKKNESLPRNFFIAGCIASIAFFIRFQTVLLTGGFLFYQVLNLKKNFRSLLWYGAGFISVGLLCVYLDYLFYHKWCFTPWNYFFQNIIEGHAAGFGVEPFYYYFYKVFMNAFPLIGIIIIASFIIYVSKKFMDEISFAVLFFLIGHFITGHKEMRFVFSLILIFPFVFAYSAQWIMQFKFTKTILFRILIALTIISNLILLSVATIIPADSQVGLQKAIYDLAGNRPSIVFYEAQNPFIRVNLKMNFYQRKNMRLFPLDSLTRYSKTPERVLIVSDNPASQLKTDPNFHCIYKNIPDWILKLNFHNWVSRTWIYCIYEMRSKTVK